MRSQTQTFLALVLVLGGQLFLTGELFAQPLLERGGVDVVGPDGRFRLDVGVGVAGIDGFDPTRLAVTVTPRYELRSTPRGRLDLALPILWIPEPYPDPWGDPCPDGAEGDVGPCGFGSPFVGVEADDLEVGPTIAVAPSLEWTFRTGCCLRPSVFLGAGVRHDGGRSTPFFVDGPDGVPVELGQLTTENTTSPLVTFGVAVTRPLSRTLALRLEARGMATFYDDMTVTGPGGSEIVLDGGSVTSAVVTVGVQIGF